MGDGADVSGARRSRGQVSAHSGVAAEMAVERHFLGLGRQIVARRFRGTGAEIDLICRDGPVLVFVEVKRAATFDEAAGRLGAAQQRRILRCAEEFLASQPDGSLTEMRFDLALVDGTGAVHLIENAFWQE